MHISRVLRTSGQQAAGASAPTAPQQAQQAEGDASPRQEPSAPPEADAAGPEAGAARTRPRRGASNAASGGAAASNGANGQDAAGGVSGRRRAAEEPTGQPHKKAKKETTPVSAAEFQVHVQKNQDEIRKQVDILAQPCAKTRRTKAALRLLALAKEVNKQRLAVQ